MNAQSSPSRIDRATPGRLRATTARRRGHALLGVLLWLPALGVLGAATVEYGALVYHQTAAVAAANNAVRVGAAQPRAWTPSPVEVAEGVAADELGERGVEASTHASVSETALTVWVEIPYRPLIGLLPTPQHVTARASLPLAFRP